MISQKGTASQMLETIHELVDKVSWIFLISETDPECLDYTLSILVKTQFTQGYSHVADQKLNYLTDPV